MTLQKEQIPKLYRVSRVLALLICVPAAALLLIGLLVPVGAEVSAVVEQREARPFNAKGYEGVAHILHTDRGEVEISEALFVASQVGDTLSIQRGAFKFGVRDFDQHVSLVRSGRVVREERPSDLFTGVMVLWVLFPLLAFRPYEKWKDSTQTKVMLVMVPPAVLIIFLTTL